MASVASRPRALPRLGSLPNSFVFPALLLNYFGQGALLLRNPAAVENPFYLLAPRPLLIPLLFVATAATIVASQALISGAFSLTQQAVQLGYMPRMTIRHTSAREAGQIYIPEVNKALALGTLCVALLFGLLAREVFRTPDTRAFDREVTLGMRELHSVSNDRIARIVSFFGSHIFILPATVLVTAGLWLKHHWASALLFAGSVFGGFALNALLKIAFARERPDLWPALVTELTYSFPSGHATMSTVFFGGAAAVVLHLSRRPILRAVTLVLATSAILMVAASRVYLGAHWTSDVAGGALLGFFWVSVCSTGTEYISRRIGDSRPSPPAPAT